MITENILVPLINSIHFIFLNIQLLKCFKFLQHLGEGVDVPSEYSEMTCCACMLKHSYLTHYKDKSLDVSLGCPLKKTEVPDLKPEAHFWLDGWRGRLCKCADCKDKYTASKIEFLFDETDMVQEYERQGLEQPTQYEQGMQALSEMDRTKQIDAIAEYGQMKEELKTFLATFAEEKKVVTETDIKDFFDGLKAKRRRLDGPNLFV
jgi:hypothetical protein